MLNVCFMLHVYQSLHKAAETGQMSRVISFVDSGANLNIEDAKHVSICNCIKLNWLNSISSPQLHKIGPCVYEWFFQVHSLFTFPTSKVGIKSQTTSYSLICVAGMCSCRFTLWHCQTCRTILTKSSSVAGVCMKTTWTTTLKELGCCMWIGLCGPA